MAERQPPDPLAALGLGRPINLAGPLTRLGAAPVSPRVARAVAAALEKPVEMDRLLEAAGARVAAFMEAEAATFSHCTAASLAIAAAAAMTGGDEGAVARLPDSRGLRNEIVLMKGHDVDYGASVTTMLRLAGAVPVEAGAANACDVTRLEAAIGERTAAAVFVFHSGTPASGLLDLPRFIHAAHGRGVPVIVDAAGETHWTACLDAGADLVLVSAQKELGGPTAGIVAGRRDLVAAAALQERGIGRAMKPTKEAVLGLLAALDGWISRPTDEALLRRTLRRLRRLPGVSADPVADRFGKPVTRLRLTIDPVLSGVTARDLAATLKRHDPPIHTGEHALDAGILSLDLRWATRRELETALTAIAAALNGQA